MRWQNLLHVFFSISSTDKKQVFLTFFLTSSVLILHYIFHLSWFSTKHYFFPLYIVFIAHFLNFWAFLVILTSNPGIIQKIVILPLPRPTSTKTTSLTSKSPKTNSADHTSKSLTLWQSVPIWENSNFAPLVTFTDPPEPITAVSVEFALKEWTTTVHGSESVLESTTTNTFTSSY